MDKNMDSEMESSYLQNSQIAPIAGWGGSSSAPNKNPPLSCLAPNKNPPPFFFGAKQEPPPFFFGAKQEPPPFFFGAKQEPPPPLQVCRAICESQKLPCMRPSDVTGLKAVRSLNLPADKIQPLVLRSFRILHLLGLGVTSLSANMAGSKTLYFTKLPEELLAHPQVVQAMRSILDAAATYRTQTQAAILAARKASQAAIVWPDPDSQSYCEASQATRQALAAFAQQGPAQAAP